MDEKFKDISIVKIYFRYGQRATGQTFWQRLWSNSLGQVLLKKAKEMNINQANIFTAKSGYLAKDNISFNISEMPPSKNPVCLELVDNAEKLQAFLTQNKSLLKEAEVILINNHCYQLQIDR